MGLGQKKKRRTLTEVSKRVANGLKAVVGSSTAAPSGDGDIEKGNALEHRMEMASVGSAKEMSGGGGQRQDSTFLFTYTRDEGFMIEKKNGGGGGRNRGDLELHLC